MDYKQKLLSFDYSEHGAIVRSVLEKSCPKHNVIDYSELFNTFSRRTLMLWNKEIVPDLDIKRQRSFEKSMARVNMRAGKAIPWSVGFGYIYGAACHSLAGGDENNRNSIAVTTGLYMFVLGLFDHLLDDFPEEFNGVGDLITRESIRQWTIDHDASQFCFSDNEKLGSGLVDLYRLYLERCHKHIKTSGDNKISDTWFEALQYMHKVEEESVSRSISTIEPTLDLITHAENPSTSSFWVEAITACMLDGDKEAQSIKAFSHDFGRLTWMIDDVADITKDVQNDIWSGFGIRLALDANNQSDADDIAYDLARRCADTVETVYNNFADLYWQAGDKYSIADIIWAYIWTWSGGRNETTNKSSSLH